MSIEQATELSGGLQLQLLGPLVLSRAGNLVVLPSSRKVRALLAYLALSPRAVSRSHLCELLWDLPNDPRGELRWCLSKLRGVLDEPGQPRVVAEGEAMRLDATGLEVDACALDHALQAGIGSLGLEALRAWTAAFRGDFLEGLDIPRSPTYTAWLTAQRRRFRAARAAVLERLALSLPEASAEAIAAFEAWLQLAPFDGRAHEGLLNALAGSGRVREGDEHLAAVARQYEAEGQDWGVIGHAWRAAKQRHAGHVGVTAIELVKADAPPAEPARTRRASLAVMPFGDRSRGVSLRGGLGDGLAHDIITRLAKLRSVFVIAQGTVFALDERHIGAEDAARRLNVDYVAGGTLRVEPGGRLSVSVQLSETRTARVLWADVFEAQIGDAFGVLDAVGDRIVASLSNQIEVAERNRAILKSPNSLDAWEAHHRGL
jgi:DNA-binding SARP family transcriptional activator/TolB-like protein